MNRKEARVEWGKPAGREASDIVHMKDVGGRVMVEMVRFRVYF